MQRLVKLHLIFLLIALFIAFVLVPLDWMYFDKMPSEEIKQYYQATFATSKNNPWKIVITWFIGLSCGRLMLKALSK